MTDSKKVIPHPRHYWAVFHQTEVMFSGTFKECWDFFVESHGNQKLKQVVDAGYRIARKA
jgi:hypothetical protein